MKGRFAGVNIEDLRVENMRKTKKKALIVVMCSWDSGSALKWEYVRRTKPPWLRLEWTPCL